MLSDLDLYSDLDFETNLLAESMRLLDSDFDLLRKSDLDLDTYLNLEREADLDRYAARDEDVNETAAAEVLAVAAVER